jgi:hypothetical protein
LALSEGITGDGVLVVLMVGFYHPPEINGKVTAGNVMAEDHAPCRRIAGD